MSQLLLIRHCHAHGPAPDAPLTDSGRAQAEALAEFLSGFAIDRIVCSPFARALATIAPFSRRTGLALEEDARLAERRLEVREDWLEIVRDSFAQPERDWPGAEAARDVQARAWLALSELFASERGLTAVVGHGQWISLVLHFLDPAFGFDAWRALTNPDVFLLYADASGVRRFERVWPEATPARSGPRRAPLAMRPQGLAGRVFGVLMERINGPAYRDAAAMLRPQPGERLLEIGFGTGRFVELLLASAPEIEVAGVDPASTMLEVASRRTRVRAAGRRADLREGCDVPLPWPDAHFDGAAALHSFQFWPEPAASFRELRRVLRPGGRLVLVLRDHSRRAPRWLPNPLSRGGRELEASAALLEATGFTVQRADPVATSPTLIARSPGLRSASIPRTRQEA